MKTLKLNIRFFSGLMIVISLGLMSCKKTTVGFVFYQASVDQFYFRRRFNNHILGDSLVR